MAHALDALGKLGVQARQSCSLFKLLPVECDLSAEGFLLILARRTPEESVQVRRVEPRGRPTRASADRKEVTTPPVLEALIRRETSRAGGGGVPSPVAVG